MNKMFTAVPILQLVQAGKIKLSDPLKTLNDYVKLLDPAGSRASRGVESPTGLAVM